MYQALNAILRRTASAIGVDGSIDRQLVYPRRGWRSGTARDRGRIAARGVILEIGAATAGSGTGIGGCWHLRRVVVEPQTAATGTHDRGLRSPDPDPAHNLKSSEIVRQ